MSNSGLFFKAMFLVAGFIVLPWGLIVDSLARTIGGLGLISLALLTDGN